MKKTEVKTRVLAARDRWRASELGPDKRPTSNDGFAFFLRLENEHSELLNFRVVGDKWQTVHGWLLKTGKMSG